MVFSVLGFGAEAFVFSYLGLTFFSYSNFYWSWHLIVTQLIIILVGRVFGTFGLIGLLKLVCCHKPRVSWTELLYIWYAGLIRGAIAFGLVLRIPETEPERPVIVTTSLTLVIFTTIIFGSTMPLVSKWLLPAPNAMDEEDENTPDELKGLIQN